MHWSELRQLALIPCSEHCIFLAAFNFIAVKKLCYFAATLLPLCQTRRARLYFHVLEYHCYSLNFSLGLWERGKMHPLQQELRSAKTRIQNQILLDKSVEKLDERSISLNQYPPKCLLVFR